MTNQEKATVANSIAIILLAIYVILTSSGCGTLTHGPTQKIWVTSDPPGAVVTNTDYTCHIVTPNWMELKRANSTILTAKKFGYETQKKKLQVHISPMLIGDVSGYWYTVQTFTNDISGMSVLFIGDMVTGSVGVLEPDTVHFVFEPMKPRIRKD